MDHDNSVAVGAPSAGVSNVAGKKLWYAMTMGSSVYRLEQYDISYPEGIEDHYWHIARNRLLFDHLADERAKGLCLLDVGCGRGVAVKTLRDNGFVAYGCEPGPADIAPSLQPFVFSGTPLENLPETLRRPVSTLLFLDVLEHLPDPKEFLQRTVPLFPKLSHILVTLPARQELWSNYDEFFGHFLRYDIDKTRQLFERLNPKGFEAGYFFHSLYLAAWMEKLIKGKREVEMNVPKARTLHRIIGNALYWESRCLPKRWFGSSLWASIHL